MKDFISAALPWVIMGLSVAVFAVYLNNGKRKKNHDEKSGDYLPVGMSMGMCIGVMLGSSDIIGLGLGISLGTFIGMLIGMCIKKS